MLISEASFVVLDLETTGLRSVAGDRIAEIAMLCWQDGNLQGEFQSLVDPQRPIPPHVTDINGISDADVRGKPTFAELVGEIQEAINGSIIVAHNAPFDIGFLAREFELLGLEPWNGQVLCTLALARNVFARRRYKLGSLARSLGVEVRKEHQALSDCFATLGVFERILAALSKQNVTTIEQLLALQGGPISWRYE